jgi:diguanylate cyclase (GGDEF)-like protein
LAENHEVPQKAEGDSPEIKPSSVLILDDSDSVRKVIRETLREMPVIGRLYEGKDGLEGLKILVQKKIDLVISDVNMPRMDGFKFLTAIRQNPEYRDLIVILLSSRGEALDKIRGLSIGANDYVTKPFEKGELQARVMVMLKMKELQEELKHKNIALETANQQLGLLANQDGLTGLPNRRYFFDRFEMEFSRARRLRLPISMIMIDIDHFKKFNDQYGHLSGDEALRSISHTLKESIRAYDMVGRYGGEEFIGFFPQTDLEAAFSLGERLRKTIESMPIDLPGGEEESEPVFLTVSMGISGWPDHPVEKPTDLVEYADKALYQAKTGGRNRCQVAEVTEPPEKETEKSPD